MALRIILGLTIREARRRKVLWGMAILSVLFIGLYALGLAFVHDNLVRYRGLPSGAGRGFTLDDAYNFWLTAALYGANFLVVMMAVLTSVDTLAGEINTGTIQSIAVKPLRRYEILLGKWLGFAVMLGGYVLLLIGGLMGVTVLIADYALREPLLPIGMMFLEAMVLLSVSMLGGTRLSTLATGVLGFGMFGLAFIGGWIEQIGNFPFVRSEAAATIGRLASFIMPSEAVWRYTFSEMVTGFNPFSLMFDLTSAPDSRAVSYAVGFIVFMLALALVSFQRRDL